MEQLRFWDKQGHYTVLSVALITRLSKAYSQKRLDRYKKGGITEMNLLASPKNRRLKPILLRSSKRQKWDALSKISPEKAEYIAQFLATGSFRFLNPA